MIGVNGDDNGDDKTHVIFGTLVELFGEVRDRHTVRTESRSHGRSGSCLARGELKLDIADYFLCHFQKSFLSRRACAVVVYDGRMKNFLPPTNAVLPGRHPEDQSSFFFLICFISSLIGMSRPTVDTITVTSFPSGEISSRRPL